MQYVSFYTSPIGKIMMSADDVGLTGLWFEGQKHYAYCLPTENINRETPVLKTAKLWLDTYFSGENPTEKVSLHLIGTEFQMRVWTVLQRIPYGKTVTYKNIADEIAKADGLKNMSAQAVGGAVGHNPVSVIVPCHRVVGSDNSLTGYAGGIDKKVKLLALEGISVDKRGFVVTPFC